MQVIYPKCAGLVHICKFCGAILKYEPQDIFEGKYIYCPLCKEKQECALQLNYDGLVELVPEKVEEGKTIYG